MNDRPTDLAPGVRILTAMVAGDDDLAWQQVKSLDRVGMVAAIAFLSTIATGALRLIADDHGTDVSEVLRKTALNFAVRTEGFKP